MDSARLDDLLDIQISSKAFATMEASLPADVLHNPYAFFEKVRAREGDVIRVENATIDGVVLPFLGTREPGRHLYVALGFDTVREIVANSKGFYQDYGHSMDVLMGTNQLAGMNPPMHQKYRALISKAFELHSLPALSQNFIEPMVDRLVDRIAAGERTELMRDLACRVPVLLIGHICALPIELYDEFARYAGAIMGNAYDWAGAMAASEQLRIIFDNIINEKRKSPGSDLISKLVLAEVDGERLSQEDIISTCRALIPAGIETTVRALGNMCVAMIHHPDQVERVRQDHKLVPVFLEEVLRWNGPAQMIPKRTLVDTEIAGKIVPANSHIWCYIGHANRDPRHWENPDSFDIGRKKQPHLAFSFGAHFCVGNQFARREMEIVFNKLSQRLPGLAPDPDAPAAAVRGVIFRSPDNVHALTGVAR